MSTFESFLKRIVESAFSVDFNSRVVFFSNKSCVFWIEKLELLVLLNIKLMKF